MKALLYRKVYTKVSHIRRPTKKSDGIGEGFSNSSKGGVVEEFYLPKFSKARKNPKLPETSEIFTEKIEYHLITLQRRKDEGSLA